MQFQREEHKPAEDEAAHSGDGEFPGQLGAEVGDGTEESVVQFSVVQGPLKNDHGNVGRGCEAWQDGDEEQHTAGQKAHSLLVSSLV